MSTPKGFSGVSSDIANAFANKATSIGQKIHKHHSKLFSPEWVAPAAGILGAAFFIPTLIGVLQYLRDPTGHEDEEKEYQYYCTQSAFLALSVVVIVFGITGSCLDKWYFKKRNLTAPWANAAIFDKAGLSTSVVLMILGGLYSIPTSIGVAAFAEQKNPEEIEVVRGGFQAAFLAVAAITLLVGVTAALLGVYGKIGDKTYTSAQAGTGEAPVSVPAFPGGTGETY